MYVTVSRHYYICTRAIYTLLTSWRQGYVNGSIKSMNLIFKLVLSSEKGWFDPDKPTVE